MKGSQRGFVLVLTLWVLAAIAIAAAYFGERVQTSLRLASARQDLAEAQVTLSNARAELLYRLAITPISQQGLGDPPFVIRLDGRTYEDAGTWVQLQDAGGLISLNSPNEAFLTRLLGQLGVPQERQASLVDALRDYVDEDDLRRLNGAESAQYRAIGRPDLPRNAPLVTVQEARDVFGWAQEAGLWERGGLAELVTTEGDGRLNPNTAPARVLQVLPGVTADLAQVIVARREVQHVGADWLDATLGTQYSGILSPINGFPSPVTRVTQRVPGLPWGVRYNVELTPTGALAPWKVTNFHRLEMFPPDSDPGAPSASQAASSPQSPVHAPTPPRFPPRPVEPASAPFSLAR
jgi:general secretion pathway protein K